MDSSGPTVYFSGDLNDPWVADIAGSLAGFRLIQCGGGGAGVPSEPFQESSAAKILVLHRSRLAPGDVERLAELRRGTESGRQPRIALCVGPYARYAEIERLTGFVDFILPEATARDVLPHRLARMLGEPADRPKQREGAAPVVDVVSSDFDLRRMLAETCLSAGFRAAESASLADAHPGAEPPAATVWDAPVLEPRWAEQLERRSRSGPVVALLAFADRGLVALARQSGAAACLDQPFDVDDLTHALDRLTASPPAPSPLKFQPPHATPPPPIGRGGGPRNGRRSAAARLKLDGEP